QRGRLRVLVSYSRTNFFVSEGRPRGFSCDLMNEYGDFLRRELRLGEMDLTVEFVALAPDELLPALLKGRGDVAAAIIVTPEREQQVAFSEPYLSGVNEIVVSSKSAPRISTLDALSSREVHVVKGSSAAEHLAQLSSELQKRGQRAIRIIEAREALAAE